MSKKNKKSKLKIPVLLVFDFDGVFTNNKVILDQNGKESVICCRGDGMGIEMARKSGLKMLILSKEVNPVVSARGKKLQIPVLQAVEDKPAALINYCKEKKITLKDVTYVGNDLNDISVMKIVGQTACPKDSHPMVRKIVDVILSKNGGDGAIRELIENYLGFNTYI